MSEHVTNDNKISTIFVLLSLVAVLSCTQKLSFVLNVDEYAVSRTQLSSHSCVIMCCKITKYKDCNFVYCTVSRSQSVTDYDAGTRSVQTMNVWRIKRKSMN